MLTVSDKKRNITKAVFYAGRHSLSSGNAERIGARAAANPVRRHLQAELAVGDRARLSSVRFAVAFEVFEGVIEFDAVVFQEGVDLHAGLKTSTYATGRRRSCESGKLR